MVHSASQFGKALRILRDRCGVTQDDLASLSGVSRMTIAKIETGQTGTVRLDTAASLAGALGVGIDEIAGLAPVDNNDAIREFLGSPWCAILQPALSSEEEQWLRGLRFMPWEGEKPNPESWYHLVLARRSAGSG